MTAKYLATVGALGIVAMGAGCMQTVGTAGSAPEELTGQTAAAFSTGTWYWVTNATSLKCLDDQNGGTSNGTLVQQWSDCGSNSNAQWQLIDNGSGYYQLKNNHSGLCLDQSGSTSNGSQVKQWACASSGSNANQMWQVVQQWTQLPHGGAWVGGSQYAFVSKMSGKCIDNTGSTSNGAIMTQYDCQPTSNTNHQNLNNSNQLWSLSTFNTHPGVVNDRQMLDFVKSNLGNQPWASAWSALQNDSNPNPANHGVNHASSNYQDHPPTDTYCATGQTGVVGQVNCGSTSNPDCHCHDQRDDALAAYANALEWYMTGNSAFANKAIQIMNDWSYNLNSITGSNTALQSGWAGDLFSRAAELIRWTNAGWKPMDQIQAEVMLRGVIVPNVQNGVQNTNGNWDLAAGDAMIQIGVFANDNSIFNSGVNIWNGRVPSYFYYQPWDGSSPRWPNGGYCTGGACGYCSPNGSSCDSSGYWGQAGRSLANGTCQETCRDFDHWQLGMDAMANGAETARIQGNNLFQGQAARITASMEYAAGFLRTGSTSGSGWPCGGTVSMPNGVTQGWEIMYKEYNGREGYNLPNTWAIISSHRPMNYDGTEIEAWETLTHAGVP